MTTYAGRPVFPPYFTDPSGNPQELVSITVYNRGTVVKPTLYTSRTKATPLANPFTADSLGNADFYVDPGEYDALVNGRAIPFTSVADPVEPLASAAVLAAIPSGTYVPSDPVVALTYNPNGTVATATENGITTSFTYNADLTVATTTRLGVTRTYTYTTGNLTSVA